MVEALGNVPLPRDTILNVNVPDIPFDKLQGYQATRCGARHQSQPIIPIDHPAAERLYRIGPAGDQADAGSGTDFHAVAENRISVTPLQIDMTRHSKMSETAHWLDAIGSL